MKRREFLVRTLSASAGLALSPLLLNSCSRSLAGKRLTILHTNDMHSHIDPFASGKYAGLGGMSARFSAIQQVRQNAEQVLLLDVGDVFQGTPYFNMFGGEVELRLMSELGYDATTIGNHEFDNGLDGLEWALQFANFPYLNANYDFSRTVMSGRTQPFKVFNKGGIKVGVFGLGIELEGLVAPKTFGGTVYNDPIAVAKEMVAELEHQKCDLIICLSHLGYEYRDPDRVSDKVLAQEVSGIDIILGGHTHTFMEEPFLVTNSAGFTTTINQVGWAGINLGRIDIDFSPRGKELLAHRPIELLSNPAIIS